MNEIESLSTKIINNVEQVIVGKRPMLELLMVALLCEGHVLLEDVPGAGKTMMARALAVGLGAGVEISGQPFSRCNQSRKRLING